MNGVKVNKLNYDKILVKRNVEIYQGVLMLRKESAVIIEDSE